MTDETCIRCGEPVLCRTPDRFRLKAWDMAESSASWFDGRLCVECWGQFIDFIATKRRNREAVA